MAFWAIQVPQWEEQSKEPAGSSVSAQHCQQLLHVQEAHKHHYLDPENRLSLLYQFLCSTWWWHQTWGSLPKAGCSLLASIVCPRSPETISSAPLSMEMWVAHMACEQSLWGRGRGWGRAERVFRVEQEPWKTDCVAANMVAARVIRALRIELYPRYHFTSKLKKNYTSSCRFSIIWPLPISISHTSTTHWLTIH